MGGIGALVMALQWRARARLRCETLGFGRGVRRLLGMSCAHAICASSLAFARRRAGNIHSRSGIDASVAACRVPRGRRTNAGRLGILWMLTAARVCLLVALYGPMVRCRCGG